MDSIIHSVTLDKEKCKGCTNCIKLCPTQAIRVRNGKAVILKDRCIDCGECIRVCPYHAKKAVTDSLDIMKNFKYNIALPAPTFYGQFEKVNDVNVILNALLKIGFDDVFEVAYAAQIVTRESKKVIEKGGIEKPIINSACPAVLRLISVRFPSLIDNIMPVISPMHLAGRMARDIAVKEKGLKPEEIGVFFITPCAAKATSVKQHPGIKEMNVDGAFSIKEIYKKLLPYLSDKESLKELSKADFSGVCWAKSGGEVSALKCENYIAVDGIDNVVKVFEEIENDKLHDLEFVEALACTGGCVGGPLCVENNFVAHTRVSRLSKTLKGSATLPEESIDIMFNDSIAYNPALTLDPDRKVAMAKLERMMEIYEELPGLDCGACGSPTCKTFAEDIVRGYAHEYECIFKMREMIDELALKMDIYGEKGSDV